MKDFTLFEKKIGITFKNKDLLKQIFMHKSYLNENAEMEGNERLEFLGDAVLELVVTDYLFNKFPNENEGILTNYRSALVRGANLAKVARKLGIGEYLYLSNGEEKSGGRDKDYILANTVEALIGAIFIDLGFEASKKIVHDWTISTLPEILDKGLYLDAKTFFQEKSQDILGITPHYEIVKSEGPDHEKMFVIMAYIGKEEIAEGKGSNKQKAQQNAAREALYKKGWL